MPWTVWLMSCLAEVEPRAPIKPSNARRPANLTAGLQQHHPSRWLSSHEAFRFGQCQPVGIN
jgi:hypothetical protein